MYHFLWLVILFLNYSVFDSDLILVLQQKRFRYPVLVSLVRPHNMNIQIGHQGGVVSELSELTKYY